MKDFVKERNEALLSLDKNKINAFMKKYNPNYKVPKEEKVYWAGVHKAICNLFLVPENNISLEQFEKSYQWLQKNGFKPEIGV
jgi:hypothetical protein